VSFKLLNNTSCITFIKLITFSGLYADERKTLINIQAGIDVKVRTLIDDGAKIKKENDATYMTDAQFNEYRMDFIKKITVHGAIINEIWQSRLIQIFSIIIIFIIFLLTTLFIVLLRYNN
jgi:hypothetical protein